MDLLPPQNLDAEKSLLGSVLLDNDRLDDVAGIVRAEDFYAAAHGKIWRACLSLHEAARPCDAVTVAERLGEHDVEEIGGVPYLVGLLDTVPHAGHAGYYAGIVRDKAVRRRVIFAAHEAIRRAYDESVETDEVLSQSEQELHQVLEESTGTGAKGMDEILMQALDRLNSPGPPGLTTGYEDLDGKLVGWMPGSLVLLAARPSTGKTAFAINLALWAGSLGHATLFVSLEQSELELAERALAIQSELSGHKIRANTLSEQERHRLLMACETMHQWPVRTLDQDGMTITRIGAEARKLCRTEGLKLLIVDYLQLIIPRDRRLPREQQVAEIGRGLKSIARQLKITVVALSQLSRAIETRPNKRPVLSDLRESGSLEQDADVVMFLDRPATYDESAHPSAAKAIVAKHRNGPTGDVPLVWDAASMRFLPAAANWQQDPQFAGGHDDSF